MAQRIIVDKKDINHSSSLFRGIVEENRDPLNIGRLRVRIPSLHGLKGEGVTTEGLPWAMPCFPSAGADHGTFIIPECGDIVWLLFENSQLDNPVWIGASYSTVHDKSRSLRSVGEETFTNNDNQWDYLLDTPETPSEFLENHNVKVLYKSPKGFCIYIDETDGKENLTIVDRLGQIIRMNSPANSDVVRRDLGDVENKEDLHQDAFYGSGSIELRTSSEDDEHDSYILLEDGKFTASNGNSSVTLDENDINLSGQVNLTGEVNFGGVHFSQYVQSNNDIINKVNNIINYSLKLMDNLKLG